jgi:putative membrane protein
MTMVVSHWSANAAVLAVVALVAAAHLRGTLAIARDARQRGEAPPGGLRREAVVFYAGLLAVLLALVSPVGYWSQKYIWVRSVQDLLLANVAPALIVLGAPWLALARGLGMAGRPPPAARAGRDDVARPVRDWPPLPVLAVIGFNVVWCGWHIPALYDAALRFPAVYAAEIFSYLGLGVVLWLQLIGSRPLSPALTPLRRVILLMGTITVGTVLGMVLVFGSGLAYPTYAGTGHQVLSVVYDQQTGGAVLWVLMLPAYTIAGIALLIRWLNDEETGALTSGLDRLLKPAKSAWPSRPGLR